MVYGLCGGISISRSRRHGTSFSSARRGKASCGPMGLLAIHRLTLVLPPWTNRPASPWHSETRQPEKRISTLSTTTNITGLKLTGLECHLPPPHSNQLKCPPLPVAHITTYGFCRISSYGTASSFAIGSSLACKHNVGTRIANTLSADEASL